MRVLRKLSIAAAALLVTCVLAVSARLASIIKYESVIHEFDPYFNYREFAVACVWRERREVGAGQRALGGIGPSFFFSLSLSRRCPLSRALHLPPYAHTGVTQFLVDNDLYRLWNWFDDRTW